MTDAGFVLVGSPFTGPFAWSRVADVLRGRGLRVAVHGVDDADSNRRSFSSGTAARDRTCPRIADELGRCRASGATSTRCFRIPAGAGRRPCPHANSSREAGGAWRSTAGCRRGREWWGDERDARRSFPRRRAAGASSSPNCPARARRGASTRSCPRLPESAVGVRAAQRRRTRRETDGGPRAHGWPTLVARRCTTSRC